MVAIALNGYYAMGRAPVIANVPDIIIGDNGATPANTFTYPDAFNLNDKVSDEDNTDDQIIWSFYEASGTYMINGVPTLSVGQLTSATLINPPTNRRILGPGINPLDSTDGDSSAVTATFRNAHLSPIGGPNTDPGAAGIVTAETKVLTLFASDGATVTEGVRANKGGMMMIYINNDGDDKTSPSGVAATAIFTKIFTTSTGMNQMPEAGTVTFSVSANAICLEVPGPGDNRGEWGTKYDDPTLGIDLVANNVYHARIQGRTNQSSYGTIPMWMFLFENGSNSGDPGVGAGSYTSEHVFLAADNQLGANAIGSRDLHVYFAPLAFQTAQWNNGTTGAFISAYDPYNDMRVRFRAFDYENGGWGGATDLGQICVEQLTLERFNYADRMVVGEVYNQPVANLTDWSAHVTSGAAGDMTTTVASDGVTLVHSSGITAWTNQGINYVPGDGTLGDLSSAAVNASYPVAWEPDTLFQVDVELSNPSPTTPNDQGSDLVRIGMDCPTAELSFMNGMSANLACAGTPKATKATYTMFFYSHDVSLTPLATLRRLRPRMDFLNATNYSANGNEAGATDPIKIWSVKVSKVQFGTP